MTPTGGATPNSIRAFLVAADGSPEPVVLEQEGEGGSSVYGSTSYYSFPAPVALQDKTYTALEVERGADPRLSFPLQNNVFVVPSMTAAEGSGMRFAVAERTAAAGGSSQPVEVLVSAPVRQQGTLAPRVTRHRVDVVAGAVDVPGYRLWEGSVDLGAPTTGAVAVSVTTAGEPEGDVLYVDAGVAGW